MQQEKRQGRGTSSQAYRVVGTPAVVKTYAKQVAIERFVNRGLQSEVKAHALKWGSLMECVLFNDLDISYSMVHKESMIHPKYPKIWSGTPDLLSDIKCGEIKCLYIEKFVLFSSALLSKDIATVKKEFPMPYWQVVSNCILTDKKFAELLCFIPTKSQLESILVAIEETDFLTDFNLDPNDYYQYRMENIEQFPYLPNECEMSNLNTFEFEVPVEDKVFLTKKFIEFEKLVEEKLLEFKSL